MKSGSSIRPTFLRSPEPATECVDADSNSKSAVGLVTKLPLLEPGQTWIAHLGHSCRALKSWDYFPARLMRPSAGPSRRCLLAKMFAPAASSPFKRSVRMGPTSIRIATPSFPMGSGPPKERSSNSPPLDTAAVCVLFRRLLLRRLHKEGRLSERFTENLLSWVHPGFSVFAGEPLSPEDAGQLGAARAMPASSRRFSRWILSCVSAVQR